MRKSAIIFLGLLFFVFIFQSCEKEKLKINVEGNMSYTKDIIPILTKNCISCHDGSPKPDLSIDTAYYNLQKGGYLKFDSIAEESTLYQQLLKSSHESKTIPVEKQKILLWIQQGALKN